MPLMFDFTSSQQVKICIDDKSTIHSLHNI